MLLPKLFLKICCRSVSSSSILHSSKEAFLRTKPHCNICTVGPAKHGKTTLTAAITKILGENQLSKIKTMDDLHNNVKEQKEGMTVQPHKLDYYTENRHYAHWDCPGHPNYLKNGISVLTQLKGAIFVTSVTDDSLSETKDSLTFLKYLGLKEMVVFLNKVDINKLNISDHIEMIQEIVKDVGFTQKEIPVIVGSALAALEGRDETIGKDSIMKLLTAVDQTINVPILDTNKPFLLPIEHVYLVKNVGTVVSGNLQQGKITKGMDAELLGYGLHLKTKITGLEAFEKTLPEGYAGDHVFCSVSKVDRDDVTRGMVLSAPGACQLLDHCYVEVQLVTADDGQKSVSLQNFSEGMVYCNTWACLATIVVPDKEELVPGETTRCTLQLSKQVVFDCQNDFILHNGKSIFGIGKILKVLPNLTDIDKIETIKAKKNKKKERKSQEVLTPRHLSSGFRGTSN